MLLIALMHFLAFQAIAMPAPASLPERGDLPFEVGEELVYDAKVGVFGRVGEATMRVDAGCTIADRRALRLSFDVSGGAAFLRVEDATRSWVDARTLATLRYEKSESSPLGSHSERVSVFPSQGRWEDADGRSFETATSMPIDELSLLYYVRTLPLERDDVDLRAGHFDVRRNPIVLRVLGRDTVNVPAGRFAVIGIELRVRDPRRDRGTGVIRIDLTDDDRRLPVRIRTSLPGSTPVTLVLRRDDVAAPTPPNCS
jgi:hypothetical protein